MFIDTRNGLFFQEDSPFPRPVGPPHLWSLPRGHLSLRRFFFGIQNYHTKHFKSKYHKASQVINATIIWHHVFSYPFVTPLKDEELGTWKINEHRNMTTFLFFRGPGDSRVSMVSKHLFMFTPNYFGKVPILTNISFKWVGSTTN